MCKHVKRIDLRAEMLCLIYNVSRSILVNIGIAVFSFILGAGSVFIKVHNDAINHEHYPRIQKIDQLIQQLRCISDQLEKENHVFKCKTSYDGEKSN